MKEATVIVLDNKGRVVDSFITMSQAPERATRAIVLACETNLRPTIKCLRCLEDRDTGKVVKPCEQHQ